MCAIQLALEEESRLRNVTKEIYWVVADAMGCARSDIERNLRTLSLRAWQVNPLRLQEIAPYPCRRRLRHPSVSPSSPPISSGCGRGEAVKGLTPACPREVTETGACKRRRLFPMGVPKRGEGYSRGSPSTQADRVSWLASAANRCPASQWAPRGQGLEGFRTGANEAAAGGAEGTMVLPVQS